MEDSSGNQQCTTKEECIVQDLKVNYLGWLAKRIDKTKLEHDAAESVGDLNLQIGNGAKLTVYKEMFEYILKH
jgi:glucose-6-phosphate dehydrogenase assembly protein OpcA